VKIDAIKRPLRKNEKTEYLFSQMWNQTESGNPGTNVIKLFYGRKLRIFVINYSLAFVLGKSFQSSLMFEGKVRNLLYSGEPERCLSRIGSSLTHKDNTLAYFAPSTQALWH
jgi:hypothetical protein